MTLIYVYTDKDNVIRLFSKGKLTAREIKRRGLIEATIKAPEEIK